MGMIDQGSTMAMEAWNMEAKPNLDWNHAWGTPPLKVTAPDTVKIAASRMMPGK